MTQSVVTPAAVPEDDDDILVDKAYPPDQDYMDWNYSVKFFHFSREPPPPRRSPSPPPEAEVESNPGTHTPMDSRSVSEISDSGMSTKTISSVTEKRGRGGRGSRGPRGRPRGSTNSGKRSAELSTDEDVDIPVKAVRG